MKSKTLLGITFIPQFPPEALVAFARQAEAAGFDIIWLYEDCFYAGGFSSAATMLAATDEIKVGIGILPVTVRNPLFVAMEIATLDRLYPGRFIAGFGHGFELWMKQIGAYPQSTLKAVEETVSAVRSLLSGEETSLQGTHVHLNKARLQLPPAQTPNLYVGGVREKTLRLAGKIGDGTLMSILSSPNYVRWGKEHIQTGCSEAGRSQHVCSVSVACKVNPAGTQAREMARHWIAECIQDGGPHLVSLGIAEEAPALIHKYGGPAQAASKLPDAWVNALSASGTPEQAAASVQALIEAGADSLVLAPIDSDPADVKATIHHLLPLIRNM
jgi:alkanesulfonate monooxygenase SsuD/methylene tetrahydromethanopterin reductase-like flavin-dependent oxidoreductase (luciferase family)